MVFANRPNDRVICSSEGGSEVGAVGVRDAWAETMARLRLCRSVGTFCVIGG